MRNLSLILMLALSLVLTACGDSPDLPQAVPYKVIDSHDSSPGGRGRIEVTIHAPDATTREQFAHTAMKAAVDYEKKTKAKVVSVLLEPSQEGVRLGMSLAIARYASDGGGFSGDQGWTWQVDALDKRPDERQVKIESLWWGNRDRFQVPDGNGSTMTDEPAIKQFISDQIGISPASVNLFFDVRTRFFEK